MYRILSTENTRVNHTLRIKKDMRESFFIKKNGRNMYFKTSRELYYQKKFKKKILIYVRKFLYVKSVLKPLGRKLSVFFSRVINFQHLFMRYR